MSSATLDLLDQLRAHRAVMHDFIESYRVDALTSAAPPDQVTELMSLQNDALDQLIDVQWVRSTSRWWRVTGAAARKMTVELRRHHMAAASSAEWTPHRPLRGPLRLDAAESAFFARSMRNIRLTDPIGVSYADPRARHYADRTLERRIAEQADIYRAELGLLPWSQHAQRLYEERAAHEHRRREPGYHQREWYERGTGRSTRAALGAIAEAVVRGRQLVVAFNRSGHGRRNDQAMLRDLFRHLTQRPGDLRFMVAQPHQYFWPPPHAPRLHGYRDDTYVAFIDHWQGDDRTREVYW